MKKKNILGEALALSKKVLQVLKKEQEGSEIRLSGTLRVRAYGIPRTMGGFDAVLLQGGSYAHIVVPKPVEFIPGNPYTEGTGPTYHNPLAQVLGVELTESKTDDPIDHPSRNPLKILQKAFFSEVEVILPKGAQLLHAHFQSNQDGNDFLIVVYRGLRGWEVRECVPL